VKKNKLTILAILFSLISLLLSGCTSALGDRETYEDSEKTGMELNIARVAVDAANGIYSIPFPTSEGTGFAGSVNDVNSAGTRYTDQTGAAFTVEDGIITAPKDENGAYIGDEMLVWFMKDNDKNAGKDAVEDYTFPLQISGTFILTDSASYNPTTYELSGQYAGMTIGFIDNMDDQNQNGGMMLKAINTSGGDYLLFQIPDVTTALGDELGFLDIAYQIPQGIPLNIPFEMSIRISGGSPDRGPVIHIFLNGEEVFPEGTGPVYNGSTYSQYVSDASIDLVIFEILIWDLIKGTASDEDKSNEVWSMLWSGGVLIPIGDLIQMDTTVPGSINTTTGMAVFIVDMGASEDGSNSVKLVSLDSTTVEEDMYQTE